MSSAPNTHLTTLLLPPHPEASSQESTQAGSHGVSLKLLFDEAGTGTASQNTFLRAASTHRHKRHFHRVSEKQEPPPPRYYTILAGSDFQTFIECKDEPIIEGHHSFFQKKWYQ